MEGIDAAILFGTQIALTVNGLMNKELAAVLCRAVNEWLIEYCSADKKRLLAVGLIPCQDSRAAVKELEYLAKAGALADAGQAAAINALIGYYRTGEFADWLKFDAAWVRSNPRVDFANGFIEVYRDARAAKGTSQAFVTVTDVKMDALMQKLAANAQYFEDRAPWAQQYKKQGVKPPMA